MAGFGRRSKPLKAGTAIAQVEGVGLTGIATGDLLVYDATSEAFLNTKTLTGSYTITSGLTAATLTSSGNATLGGALSVAGNSTLTGTLSVTGATALQTTSALDLTVTGDFDLAGDLTVGGALSATTADFAQLVTANLGLRVFGATTLGAVTATTGSFSSTLDVTGAAVLGSNLSVAGDLAVLGMFSTGSSFSASSLGSSGTLSAGGATSLASTLSVAGATTLSAALTGTTAAFTSTVRSEGTLTVGTTAGVHQDIDTDETIWFNGASRLGEVGMTTGSVWYVHVGSPAENAIVATLNAAVDLYYNNAKVFETISGGAKTTGTHQITGNLDHDGSNVGFYSTAPAAKQTVTGSRGGNAALASLLTGLAAIGLITDSSSA